MIKMYVRCGVRTHAHNREPELKSGALDHSANLTSTRNNCTFLTLYKCWLRMSKNNHILTNSEFLIWHAFNDRNMSDEICNRFSFLDSYQNCWTLWPLISILSIQYDFIKEYWNKIRNRGTISPLKLHLRLSMHCSLPKWLYSRALPHSNPCRSQQYQMLF